MHPKAGLRCCLRVLLLFEEKGFDAGGRICLWGCWLSSIKVFDHGYDSGEIILLVETTVSGHGHTRLNHIDDSLVIIFQLMGTFLDIPHELFYVVCVGVELELLPGLMKISH